jgi:macrolide transport system ATP-binding/permease protein
MRELLRTTIFRFASLFHKRRLDFDLDAEMHSHLEMAVDLNMRKGMSVGEARRRALIGFGGIETIKESYRDQRGLPVVETTLQDVRFGFRMFRRSPGFSLLAILCLTVAIGANAAVFSWIEGILFRPYPAVAHQERMVALAATNRGSSEINDISLPDLMDFQKNSILFESFIVDRIMGTTLSIGDRAERATGSIVSSNYFDALRIHPILGRGFRPEEDTGRNAHPVTVISYQTWQDRYAGDPAIIGRQQYLNGVQHTIVGVAPKGFDGTFIGYAFQFWVPLSMQETFTTPYKLEDRGAQWVEGFGFLKPGVSRQQAQTELSAIAQRLESAYPRTNRGRGVRVFPLWETPFNGAVTMGPTLKISLAVVVFVLVIACANVSNLLMVRAFARRQEITIRLAIGAGRARLLRQLLTEGLILSLFASVGGLIFARWCRNALMLFSPPLPSGVIVNLPGEIDLHVLALSVGVCVLATLLFALIPAFQASKIDLAGALKSGSGGVVGGTSKSRLRATLVLIQVSFSFVLVVATGLLLESSRRMQSASPGFSTDDVLTSTVDLFAAGYDKARARNFRDQLIDRVQALPGIQSAAFSRSLPFSYGGYPSAPVSVIGYVPPLDEDTSVEFNSVSPGYFATVGIPLLTGREFTRVDDEKSAPVAIINQSMAAKFWANKNPVGDHFLAKDQSMLVVGVAKDSKYRSMRENPKPFYYIAIRQSIPVNSALFMHTSLSPAMIAPAIAREIRAIDPGLAPMETITMRQEVDRMSYAQRLAVALLTAFGGIALLLAAIGLYGVMSYSVSQSKRELGLRMAVGAGAADLLRLVMSQGLMLTAGGIVLGAIASLALTRFIGNLLYKISPRDPMIFAYALVVMTVVSLAACFLPAWRASRIDPVRALRE